ncbi:MAG: hypothetical protein WDM71_03130 [Ferruginibacter sp.]
MNTDDFYQRITTHTTFINEDEEVMILHTSDYIPVDEQFVYERQEFYSSQEQMDEMCENLKRSSERNNFSPVAISKYGLEKISFVAY